MPGRGQPAPTIVAPCRLGISQARWPESDAVRSEQSFGRGVMASRTTGSATHIGGYARAKK
jgi:hypothetical protein